MANHGHEREGEEEKERGGRGFQCGADVSSCNGTSGTEGVSRSPHARESDEGRKRMRVSERGERERGKE